MPLRRACHTQDYAAGCLDHRFDLSPIDVLVDINVGCRMRHQITVRLGLHILTHLRSTLVRQHWPDVGVLGPARRHRPARSAHRWRHALRPDRAVDPAMTRHRRGWSFRLGARGGARQRPGVQAAGAAVAATAQRMPDWPDPRPRNATAVAIRATRRRGNVPFSIRRIREPRCRIRRPP